MSMRKEGKHIRDPHRRQMGRHDDCGVPASKSGGGSDEARRQRASCEEG
jgi:hypothetical protein